MENIIQVGDASIFYKERGNGYPLILIAGFTCDHTLWKPIVKPLAEHFRVIRPDNRGVGRTKDKAKHLSTELLAEDLLGFMDALEIEKAHIIGQSMGGTIAQTFAVKYPHKVNKLGLLVTSAKWRQATILAMRSHLNMERQGVSEDLLFDAIAPWVYGEKLLSNRPLMESLKQFALSNPHPQSLEDSERQFALLKDFDGRQLLAQIQAPTLVMYGKEDLLTLPEESHYLAAHIPHAQIKSFDTAHGVILEESEKLAESIVQFFRV